MDHVCIEADAQHLHEQPGAVGSVGLAGPECAGASERQRGGYGFGREGQAEFMRQDIGSTERDDTEAGGGTHEAVGDLGDGAIAAGRDDHLLPASRCLARQGLGVPGSMGLGKVQPDAIGDEDIEHPPEQMGAAASGDGIEDDDHRRIGACLEDKDVWMPLQRCHFHDGSMTLRISLGKLTDIACVIEF